MSEWVRSGPGFAEWILGGRGAVNAGAGSASEFDGQSLDLERRVLFVHGAPAEMDLPATVGSLGPIPAQTTLPIACGTIERAG